MKLHKSFQKYSDKFISSFATRAESESYIQFTKEVTATLRGGESVFSYCQFEDTVSVVSLGRGNNSFKNCVFKGNVHLAQMGNSVHFLNCYLEGEVIFESKNSTGLISFNECELSTLVSRISNGSFQISSSTVKSILHENCSIRRLELVKTKVLSDITGSTIEKLIINTESNINAITSKSFDSVSINSSQLKLVELSQAKSATFSSVHAKSITFKSTERIVLANSEIDSVSFNECNFNNFFVNECNCGEFVINNLRYAGSSTEFFKINHLLVSGSFEINDSTLGNAVFEFLLVRSANVVFRNSDYADWEFNKVDWPTGYEIDLGYTGMLSENLVHRDFYRELKRKCIANENTIDAAYFKSKEMIFHTRYIGELSKEYKRIHGRIKYLKNDLFSEWFILWTNKVFSGFGGNVWRPLLLGLIFHLLFFNLFLLDFSHFGIKAFYQGGFGVEMASSIKGVVKYLEMFNPLHSFDDKVKLGIGALFMDIVMRVSSGYFIFYILRASRKFAK
ncbi:hypothetical protein [Ekhidna sp.]